MAFSSGIRMLISTGKSLGNGIGADLLRYEDFGLSGEGGTPFGLSPGKATAHGYS
jgi:hypothetical protein